MHMGTFCKIFMTFPVRFWVDGPSFFYIASANKGRYAFWKPLDHAGGGDAPPDLHYLMCVAVGEEGQRVEKMQAEGKEEEIKDEIEQVLKKTFEGKLE